MDKKRFTLNGDWNLEFTMLDGRRIQTTTPVPGNVEPTLVKLGLVEDYMPADSVSATRKFEAIDDWCYTTRFDAPAPESGWTQQLVFEGIDTIAQVYLNDEQICDCMDMHLAYRADVTGKLKEKDNVLKVVIRSSQLWARKHCHDAASNSTEYPAFYSSRTYLRKARHQWGWDNAPRLLTSGIIRPVWLEEIPPRGFEEVYLYTKRVGSESVELGTDWQYRTELPDLSDYTIQLTLLDGDRVVYERTMEMYFIQGTFRYTLPKDQVKLWWPTGFGEPYLYTVRLKVFLGQEVESVYESPFGIRKLNLERTEDLTEEGGAFCFRINGERVYIRGANWKPQDPLASLADAKTATCKALEEVRDLHCNMVRIWGGGIYEGEAFFDYCDRHGIMVWQDFMFACEIPPSDEWFCRLVAQEAKYIIKKQRNHPSLAVWCGDNEDDECVSWLNQYSAFTPSCNVINRKILRDAVLHFDPYRDYVPSSPYVSDANFVQREEGREMTHFTAEEHLYPIADPTRYGEFLRKLRSLFIGETGPYHANPAATNPRLFEREKGRAGRLWDQQIPFDTGVHQFDKYFVGWRTEGKRWCEKVYGRDFSFAEWKDYTLALNLLCAEVYKDAVEYGRASRWNKTGVIWWSLMDMWPQLFNYSIMDCDYNRKLPYYWIRQSQQEFALMAVRKELNGPLVLYAANDTLRERTAEYTVTAYDANGNSRPLLSGTYTLAPNSTGTVQIPAEPEQPELWIIRWNADGVAGANHVFTRIASYDTMKRWTEIVGEQCGFRDEILELQ